MARYRVQFIAACTFAAVSTLAAAENRHDSRPPYLGVRLGQSQDEIEYILGHPPSVVDDQLTEDEFAGYKVYDTSRKDSTNALPEGKNISAFRMWSYPKTEGRIDLTFSKDGSGVESITCYSDSYRMCPPLYGIRVGQTEEQVIQSLGKPSSSFISGVSKTLVFLAFGLDLTLTQNRVYMIKLHQ